MTRPATSKKSDDDKSAIIVFDECGFGLSPTVRATWAKKGVTPVDVCWPWGSVTALGAIVILPPGHVPKTVETPAPATEDKPLTETAQPVFRDETATESRVPAATVAEPAVAALPANDPTLELLATTLEKQTGERVPPPPIPRPADVPPFALAPLPPNHRHQFKPYVNLLADNKKADARDIIGAMEALEKLHPGPKTYCMDGARIHFNTEVDVWLARHPHVKIERFPPYTPELNPQELVWALVKFGILYNLSALNYSILRTHVARAFDWLEACADFLEAVVRHACPELIGACIH